MTTDLPRAHAIFQRLASDADEADHERWAHGLELQELHRIRVLMGKLLRPINQAMLAKEHGRRTTAGKRRAEGRQ